MKNFIALEVLLPQLGLSDMEWAQRRVLRLVRDGMIEPTEYSVSRHGEIKRGQPRKEYSLTRLGAYLFAMGVRTTQADEWRRLQAERLNALMEAQQNLALPSPEAAPVSLEELCARVARLEQQAAKAEQVESRVEKLEARVPEQLALPGIAPKVPWRNSFGLDFTAVLEGIREVSESERCQRLGRGMRAREIVALLEARDPSTEKLRIALGLPEGGTIESLKLGYLLRSMSKSGQPGLTAHLDGKGIALWFVASETTH